MKSSKSSATKRSKHRVDPWARDNSAMMRAIAAASPDALITIDRDSRILEFSPAAEQLYGYTREECLGRLVSEIVIPERFHSAHHAGMENYHDTGEGPVINKRVEVASVTRDGREFPAELTVIPFKIDGEQFFTAFVRDISERREHEQAMQAAREAAEQASESKSRFLALFSHELRTPLNVILGTFEVLSEDADPAARERLVESASSSGQQLLEMVDQIIAFSDLEDSDEDEVVLSACKTRVLVSDIQHALRRLHPQAVERVRWSGEGTLPETLMLNKQLSQRATLNLLDNAIRHTDGDIEVTLSYVPDTDADGHGELLLQVADRGQGIDDATLQRALQGLARSDAGTRASHGGLGLGLPISRRIAQLMGGELSASSQPGQGSVFTLRWPARAVAQTDSGESPKGLRILVVDDGEPNRMVLRAMIERAGHVPVLAASGEQALERLADAPVDLVLMDMRMPELDGLQTTREIRRREADGQHVPIIALTANNRAADRRACFDAGMDDFLSKPINLATLNEVLASACQRR